MLEFKSNLAVFLKGVIIALVFSLLSVLVFAFIIKVFSLPMGSIKPIVTVIKIIAVFLGVIFSIGGEKGLLKGAILGFIISLLSFILFGIIGKNFSFSLSFLWDILLGLGVGAISGIVAVNLKK
ncbi:MAG: TIGR04086 family membrane protein [Clostridia bacterium]|nr:TIGR04086 family membrane protein [Clostridia bacterium]